MSRSSCSATPGPRRPRSSREYQARRCATSADVTRRSDEARVDGRVRSASAISTAPDLARGATRPGQPARRLRPDLAPSTWSSWNRRTSRRGRDFLAETLPYTATTSAIAIVQTPQYFRTSPAQTWIELRGRPDPGGVRPGTGLEQWLRQRLDAAVLLRDLLAVVPPDRAPSRRDGPTLIPYAEDVHTGLVDVRRALVVRWPTCRCCSPPGSARTTSTPSCASSTAGAPGTWASASSRRLWTVPMSAPGPAGLRLRVLRLRLHRARITFFGPLIPVIMLAFLPGHVRRRGTSSSCSRPCSPAFVLYPLVAPVPLRPGGSGRSWAPPAARGACVRHLGRRLGPVDELAADQVRRAVSLRRFRIGITSWSGSAAVLWLALALWRTAALGSPQSAVLLFFGLAQPGRRRLA